MYIINKGIATLDYCGNIYLVSEWMRLVITLYNKYVA